SKPLEHSSDKFDDFFFSTLEHLMPKHLIEDYRSLNSQIKRFFKSTGKLKCVVSEVWLSNSQACVALSYLRERGSIHIYNEHNALFHPFVGGMVDFIAGHCDKYFTIGWTPKKYHTNILRGASLYGFQQNVKEKPNGRILFISGPYQYKMPNYSALYGLCGDYFVTNHVEFLRTFFRSLDAGIKKRIDYRPYPTNYGMDILLYDKEELLKPHLNSCNIIRNFSVKAKALLG